MTIPRFKLSAQSRSTLLLAVLVSFLLVTVLRVISAEVRIFACLQNYIFAAAIFGFGIGCLNAAVRSIKAGVHRWFLYFTIALTLLVLPHFTYLSNLGILRERSSYFYYPIYLPDLMGHELTSTTMVFLALGITLLMFRSLGLEFGRSFDVASVPESAPASPLDVQIPLRAYFVLMVGMAAGWLFGGILIGIGAPPVVLVAVVVGFLFLLGGMNVRNTVLAALALISAFTYSLTAPSPALARLVPSDAKPVVNFWRPYYHVEVYPIGPLGKVIGYAICGNHSPLQFMFDLNMSESDANFVASSGEVLTGYTRDYYDYVYMVAEHPRSVLVLGAGAGNEVAAALKHGAEHVDAVDAQEWLFDVGSLHPQKPYSSPKVRRIVADPRQYLRNTREKYDLIVFANLESQTDYAPFGILRTDNYVYSTDGLVDAKLLLKPGGFVAVSFVPIRGWLGMRMAHNMLLANNRIDAQIRGVYRHILFAGTDRDDLLTGKLLGQLGPARVSDVSVLEQNSKDVWPSYDDWPYAFSQWPTIPRTYLYCMTITILCMMLLVRSLHLRSEASSAVTIMTRENLCVILLGAALMLLQERAATTFAYNFGSTWDVAVNSALSTTLVVSLAIALSAGKLKVPGWVFWPVSLLLIFAEALVVNYQAVNWIDNVPLRFLASALLPLLPTFLVACALTKHLKLQTGSALALGLLFSGAGIGAILESFEVLHGVSTLSFIAILMCLITIGLSIRKKNDSVPASTAEPATT